jgi:integrase
VYHKGKKRYPATNYFLSKDDLTKSMKIKNQMYIDAIDEMLKKCRSRCNNNATRIGDMDVDRIVELVVDIIEGREETSRVFKLDIIEYGRKYIKSLEEQNISGNSKVYKVALNNLAKFAGRESLDINEITTRFVNDWIKWIRERPSKRVKGGRAESLYPETIRSLHNLAKDEYNNEDIGDIKIPLSPFKKARIPEVPGKIDIDLPVEDLMAIHNLPYIESVYPGNNKFNFAKDIFMLSFMLIGMNIADLYSCTIYTKERITYYRTKVKNRRGDMGLFSVKVEPEVLNLMRKYRDPSGERVFCFYKMYASVDTFTAAVNGLSKKKKNGKIIHTGLKKVGEEIGVKGLKFYSARHTWATIARNNVGIDKYTVHEALNHVDEEMKATDIYLKRDWSQIDKANRATLDFVFNIKPTE